jgi:voltage-gated sodium channel
MEWFQYLFQAYFMFDIFLRVKAHYPDYLAYLRSPWNAFDVILVLLTLLPILATGTSARDSLGLFRVGRILRVLRLLTWVETLNIILQAISNSTKALVFVVVLMWIFFYNYAIMGVFLFRGNDPHHFGTLPKSLLSLFQVRIPSPL